MNMKEMKKLQIGIMGSAADLNYGDEALLFAKKIGKCIAESGNILVYGAEKEYSSLSTNAAMEASKNGGTTVGITGGKDKKIYGEYRPDVLIPCGLGARDTLRMEAAMPLYGHEMTDDITPLETGLKFAVKMTKDDFIGKKALEEKGTPAIKRVGLKVVGRGIVREHQEVYVGEELIGHTTSGTHCPFLGCAVAMALVKAEYAEIGTRLTVVVRGRKVEVEVVALPFYKRAK